MESLDIWTFCKVSQAGSFHKVLGVAPFFIKLKNYTKLSKSFAPVTHYYKGFFIAFRFVVI